MRGSGITATTWRSSRGSDLATRMCGGGGGSSPSSAENSDADGDGECLSAFVSVSTSASASVSCRGVKTDGDGDVVPLQSYQSRSSSRICTEWDTSTVQYSKVENYLVRDER